FVDVFQGKPIQEPTFSPDATEVAFVHENNIDYQDLILNQIFQVTTDGKKNEIINVICYWVYEEEFGFVRHFDFSADGKYFAFVRIDEFDVDEYFISIYQGKLYTEVMIFKYEKAGEDIAKVFLHIYA